MQEVVDALDCASDELSSYVNRLSGEVRTVTHEELRFAEEEGDPEMPEWQREAVSAAKEVLDSKDWLELPSKFDIHEWDIMDRFGGSLTPEQQTEVRNAIRGSGAFRNFKGALRRLGVEDAWFKFKRQALEDIARGWLEEHDLQAVEGAAQPGVERRKR
jgi:hypothetical protein